MAYAVTGNLLLSLTLSLLEPAVQAVAFFFHEKAWHRWGNLDAARKTEMAPDSELPQWIHRRGPGLHYPTALTHACGRGDYWHIVGLNRVIDRHKSSMSGNILYVDQAPLIFVKKSKALHWFA